MGIKDMNFKKQEPVSFIQEYSPQIVTEVITAKTADKVTNPQFKGEVKQNIVKFPDVLGEEHPFDFAITEGLYKKFGFGTAVVDKYVDYIVGPGFWVSSEKDEATTLIKQWMQDVDFDTVLRGWIKEALVKNGFLELGGKKGESIKGVKILDSKYMYVERDNKGTVKRFNQYRGGFQKFAKEKIIPFDPHQIAHISFNKIGDMSYGMGIMYPAANTINNLLQNETDMHMLMHRKANSPYHIKLGGVVGGKYYKPKASDVTKMGKDLEWLNNKHEWVTDGLTEIKVVDFGNIGEKFNEVLKYDSDMLIYTFQVPAVLMGMANINEGIAKVQMDAFQRRITSFQVEIEKVIEQKIFQRILVSNGMDVHVEFNWGRPSSAERYERVTKLTEVLKTPLLSQTLAGLLEADIVKSLELDEDVYEQLKLEEDKKKEVERKREEARAQPLVPGQNAKPPTKQGRENYELLEDSCSCSHCKEVKESGDNYNDVNEWLGFDYQEYIKQIESVIKAETFSQIAASSKLEEAAGMLSQSQVSTFKGILENGFKKGHSIDQMVKAVNKKVGLKDLLKMEGDKIMQKDGVNIVVRHGDKRAVGIVRTEVTRTANAGAIKHFKEGGISKIRWVASAGARTCVECESLNGLIFDIDSHPAIPVHVSCRCTVVPVTELS